MHLGYGDTNEDGTCDCACANIARNVGSKGKTILMALLQSKWQF
jgi:hypothetical protein